MSAEFWTKILTEIKTGANSQQVNKWRRESESLQFNSETIYVNDLHASIKDWFTRKKSSLPRSVMRKENILINNHIHDHIDKYIYKTMYNYGKSIKDIKTELVGKGGGGVRFHFLPQAAPAAGGIKTGQKKVFKNWNKKRKDELATMSNNLLNTIINDPQITTKKVVSGTGAVYRGGAYKSSSSISAGSGVQDGLHGDLRERKRTTVAAYGGRQGVRAKRGHQRHDRDWLKWAEEMKSDNLQDYHNFDQATSEFEERLIDWIDEEYGFEVLQDNPVDGSKLKDQYILVSKTRGNARENKRMRAAGGDVDKVYDDMISRGVEAIREDMLKKYSAKGFVEGIEASLPLVERGKRAVTKQATDKIKKATRGNKAVKVKENAKKPVKGKKYKTPTVKNKGKRRSKSKARNPKKKSLNLAAGAARGSMAKPVAGRNGKGASPIALMTLINKVLPQELMKNMTGVYPRSLENRTGRFAESAQVTQVVPFPRMVEVRYTYQKDPYQVFEPGSGDPRASTGRDPRRIIGGTIREIAQEMMGTKFGLVRTKRL